MFEFALGGGAPLCLQRRQYRLQAELALDLAHQHFLAPVLVAVTRDGAIELDPVGQQVNVFVLGVVVPRNDVLVTSVTSRIQIKLIFNTFPQIKECFNMWEVH